MEHPDARALVLRRARFVYESARLRSAVVRAWPILLAAALAIRLGSSAERVITLAIVLAVAAIALMWRGRVPGRAVEPGMLAGVAPLVLPGIAMGCASACSASCATWCATSCVAGGLIAGGVIGTLAAKRSDGGWLFGLTAAAIAAATGAMGCSIAGATGVAGMLAGLGAGAVPLAVFSPRRS